MSNLTRRNFIGTVAAGLFTSKPGEFVITVNGKIPAASMGVTLIHEHFLVDFIGADKTNFGRWNRKKVVAKMLPFLVEAKQSGVKTIMDCTPAFLGRDVQLLKMLSDAGAINVLTNTGYYGAGNNKYLPEWAFAETDEQLAKRWTREYDHGIENSTIKPGFIKIGVNPDHLSLLHQKIVKAAALTHLQTGLTICSHTGIAVPAFEEIQLLQKMKVHPSAFVWTHAQAEQDSMLHVKAARLGAWVSLDGLGGDDPEKYAGLIDHLKTDNLLHKVLLSHDAGWYKPGEAEGGSVTGYTKIFTGLIPLLKKRNYSDADIEQLLVKNPQNAFAIRKRRE